MHSYKQTTPTSRYCFDQQVYRLISSIRQADRSKTCESASRVCPSIRSALITTSALRHYSLPSMPVLRRFLLLLTIHSRPVRTRACCRCGQTYTSSLHCRSSLLICRPRRRLLPVSECGAEHRPHEALRRTTRALLIPTIFALDHHPLSQPTSTATLTRSTRPCPCFVGPQRTEHPDQRLLVTRQPYSSTLGATRSTL